MAAASTKVAREGGDRPGGDIDRPGGDPMIAPVAESGQSRADLPAPADREPEPQRAVGLTQVPDARGDDLPTQRRKVVLPALDPEAAPGVPAPLVAALEVGSQRVAQGDPQAPDGGEAHEVHLW
jgi:hypothetical protein